MVKVGDRIRLLCDDDCDAYERGDIVMVSEVDDDGVYFNDNDDDRRYLVFEDFEPVAVADSNGNQHDNQPKFKVGDRVRMIKDGLSTTGAVGKLATIDSWNGVLQSESGQYLLKIDPPIDYKTLSVTKEYTRATADCFEPANAPLTIREGRFYRTRDGRKVGPIKETGGLYGAPGFSDYEWYSTGCVYSDGREHEKDIIAEWTDADEVADCNNNYDTASTTGFTVPLDAPEFANDNDEPDGKLQVCNLEIAYQMAQTGVCTINEVRKNPRLAHNSKRSPSGGRLTPAAGSSGNHHTPQHKRCRA